MGVALVQGGLYGTLCLMRTATQRLQNMAANSQGEFLCVTDKAAQGAELSAAAGGRPSRRTPDRRGGQLLSDAQIGLKPSTDSPEEQESLCVCARTLNAAIKSSGVWA